MTLVPYTEGGSDFDVYVARPASPEPHPAVLIFHAFGGRNEFAEEKARKLAELGYVGAAVDLYGVGKRGTDRASSQVLMMELVSDPPLLRRRIEAAYGIVRELDGTDPERMGAIGFCFGGLCSILAGRMGLDLRGVVSFHGLLKIGESLDQRVRARILVLHGQNDPLVPPSDVGLFAEEMKRVGADWELHAYPGAAHSFTNPEMNDLAGGFAYDENADRRSWTTMKRFFEEVFE